MFFIIKIIRSNYIFSNFILNKVFTYHFNCILKILFKIKFILLKNRNYICMGSNFIPNNICQLVLSFDQYLMYYYLLVDFLDGILSSFFLRSSVIMAELS